MAPRRGLLAVSVMLFASGLLSALPSVVGLAALGVAAWQEGPASLRSDRQGYTLVVVFLGLCIVGLGKGLLELSAGREAARLDAQSAAPALSGPALRWLVGAWWALTGVAWAFLVVNVVYAVLWFLGLFVLLLRLIVLVVLTLGFGAGQAWRSSGRYLDLMNWPWRQETAVYDAVAASPYLTTAVQATAALALLLPFLTALYLHARRWR
ncbi:MAG: hypothetical protein HY909_28625 [Deltaproteobacteria bacterium]|nr:hypothetical protein [Deltaproteobacteria bacterium]